MPNTYYKYKEVDYPLTIVPRTGRPGCIYQKQGLIYPYWCYKPVEGEKVDNSWEVQECWINDMNNKGSWCDIADSVITDQKIKLACERNPSGSECKGALVKYCDYNKLNEEGREVCLKYCSLNHGHCDNFMKNHCQKNSKETICNCIINESLKNRYNPLCVDINCINYGYQTSSMKSSAEVGCRIIDCGAYFDLKASNVNLKDISLAQKCGEEPNKNSNIKNYASNEATRFSTNEYVKDKKSEAPIITTDKPIQPPQNEINKSSGLNRSDTIIIVVICALALIIIISVFFIFKKLKNPPRRRRH